jgi:hypothetical protein
MSNAPYRGTGEILQGNNSIGTFPYELGVVPKGEDERSGVVYIGNRVVPFSALQGEKLSLRLEDGSLCTFRITNVGSKMAIIATSPISR